MRAYEQIRNGPVFHGLPARIIGVGGGFEYGFGGFTHHAFEDLGIARIQPGLTVIAPADSAQTVSAIWATYDLPGPIYYRVGKRDDHVLPLLEGRFRLGRTETIREGGDILILAVGSIASEAFSATEILFRKGVRAALSIVSSLRPAPADDIRDLLEQFPVAITVEEHYVEGGLGSLISEIVAEAGIGCRIIRCGVRSVPSVCGGEAYLRKLAGLSDEGIAETALDALDVGRRRRRYGFDSRYQ
jgi:transketolase